jgi:hypothetical protein
MSRKKYYSTIFFHKIFFCIRWNLDVLIEFACNYAFQINSALFYS